jgi:Na+-driven multidrug efflux pump
VRATGQVAILAYVYVGAEVLHIALVPALVFGLARSPRSASPAQDLHGDLLHRLVDDSRLVPRLGPDVGRPVAARAALRTPPVREILRVGAPMSLAPVLNNVALATLNDLRRLLGTTSLAAFGAAVRLEYLLYPLNFGLGAGGARHGRHQHRRAPVRARRHASPGSRTACRPASCG